MVTTDVHFFIEISALIPPRNQGFCSGVDEILLKCLRRGGDNLIHVGVYGKVILKVFKLIEIPGHNIIKLNL
jgi:hypothetical protein